MGPKSDNNLTREPVAIIGVGCRFPGADDLETFWRILRDGVETIGEYPGGRFHSLDRFYKAKPGEQNSPVTCRGGFLKGLDLFDADFFGISPREARLLDPQHRLLLELGWEALEDAGLPLLAVAGSRTGVFVGQWTSDFEACLNELLPEPHLYSTTGSGRYAAAARLAYHFDLRGPNLTLDTACSSSLVAVHLACQSLRSGESDLALAGAVNLILRPEITLAYGAAGMLSPDGRCKFGDASANGYVRSEAGGVLALKLLSRALSDRDPVHAIVRGSSINNDGSSSGLLVSPSRVGQAAMIRAALDDAGISPADVDYIEAHGTGTAAGDPAELEAIGSVLADSSRDRPCSVGSVKTNVGHSEAAAGMVGLCKSILALKHAWIPAALHFHEPNPQIPWSTLPLTISGKSQPWPHGGERRIAGVNSFGITGTNAHVILENAPPGRDAHEARQSERARLFVISGRTPAALEQTASSWRARMAGDPSWPSSMADLAYTAATRRTSHPFRLAVVAKHARDLDAQLASWLEHEPGDLIHSGKASAGRRGIVFVFPGQGGQWPGMGRDLFDQEPVFREALARCDRALRLHNDWSVIEQIRSPDPSTSEDIDRVQPALFAIMIALAELWRSWGVEPDAVVGHSMGEAAAAVVCGALSLEDGAAVISMRSRLMKSCSGRGLMAMAALRFEDATEFVRSYAGRISIAANNSPSSTVLSGDSDAIEDAIAALEAREIFCRRIQVDVASHSAHMDPLAPELERSLASIVPCMAQIPLFSTSTSCVEDGLALGATYWSRNLRQPVLFAGAVQRLMHEGFQTFIEINAHPVLLHAIEESAGYAGREVQTVASLRRDKDQLSEILGALGKLHVSGHSMNFNKLYPAGECLRLPAYPWQRERYWPEESGSEAKHLHSRGPHPNLSSPIESSLDPGTYFCDVDFRPPAHPFEAAGWCLELAVAASQEVLQSRQIALEGVRFERVFATADSAQLAVFRDSDGNHRFRLSAKVGESWKLCCEGEVRAHVLSSASPLTARVVERTATAIHPLTACLRGAAESLGYAEDADGEPDWSVSCIDRIEGFREEPLFPAPMRTAAVPLNEISASSEFREENGSCIVRMMGVQFDIRRSANCSRHLYQWKWTKVASPTKDERPGGVLVICGDAPMKDQFASYLLSCRIECAVASDTLSARNLVDSLGSMCKAVIWISGERTSAPESAIDQVADVWSVANSITPATDVDAPNLWLVTTGAHQVESYSTGSHDPVSSSASQAAVWGLARVIACERPEIRCISVDLSTHPTPQELELLARWTSRNAPEMQMAIRESNCYGLRLERTAEIEPQVVLKKNCTYLITGGFGELGLALATFLCERGAQQIALVGRRLPGPAALEKIAHLESRGVRVSRFQADVAEIAQITSVVTEINDGPMPLKGVFHLAGVTQDMLLADFSRASLQAVMRPKVFGAWNLHRLTADSDLDYFVMYSSLAAVSSQPGQGSYAAANAYLDGLATLRRSRGLPGMSIQWGPWRDAGMIRQSGANRSRLAWAEQGIGDLSVETSLDGLHRLLARQVPIAFVARVDWSRFEAASGERTSSMVSDLVDPATTTARTDTGIRDGLIALPMAERAAALESHLKNILAGVLKSKASRIDSASRFGSLGVDSLMMVEIARQVTDALGIRLPVTALFNFPTLELLTKEVARRLDPEVRPAVANRTSGEAKRAVQVPEPAIAEMSEEEALQSLVKAAESK